MLVIAFILAGCGARPQPSVVGTWEAYLGSDKGEKLYFGKPEPTEIEFRSDGTYTLHLKWGNRSLAQTGGSYQVHGDEIVLSPWEDLDPNTWPGREACVLNPNGREFTMAMPRSTRVPEVSFYKLRTF
jgi:hypothetical protein